MLQDAMVDPIAPKQPHSMSIPRERTTAFAIRKEILSKAIPMAQRRVKSPKSSPTPQRNSINGRVHPKAMASGPGSISKL